MDRRILKNTLILYARTLITMLIALYTSRVVLDVLGVEDYGIYNLVAGIVLLFQSVSSTIQGATQRYVTYSIGKGGRERVLKVFSTSYYIHGLLALFVIVIGETVGLWVVNTGLIIPRERLYAANMAYQGALIVFAIDIVSIACSSLIIAYERMTAYAYINIAQAVFRLGNVFILQWVGIDKLMLYAGLELMASVITCLIFHIYCYHYFDTFRIVKLKDCFLFREISSFAGWNFLGASANVFYEQGANILLNHFFSIVLNAARGITGQVSRAVNVFVANFTIALNPQITKSYAAGEYEKTRDLVMTGSKLAFYMTLLTAFPLLINTPFILNLWLKQIPDYTISFVCLTVICVVLDSYVKPLHCVLFASGNISQYQIIVSVISLARLPILWMCFYLGMDPIWIYILIIIFCILHVSLLLTILNRRNIVPLGDYLRIVIIPSLIVLIVCGIIIFYDLGHECGLTKFIVETILSVVFLILVIYCIGITSDERKSVRRIMVNIMQKVHL